MKNSLLQGALHDVRVQRRARLAEQQRQLIPTFQAISDGLAQPRVGLLAKKELCATYVSGCDCLVPRSQVADRQLARMWLTILDPSTRVPESRSLVAEHGETMVLQRNFGLVPSMSRISD
jgi:hypothetical protein